VKSPVINQENK